MSMPVITLSSSAAKTIISHPSQLSSNVDETEETFVLKLANAQSSISIPHDHCLIFPAGKNLQAKDSEIGVFDADKYFNEATLNSNLDQSPKLVRKSLPPHRPPNYKRSEPLEIFEIKEKSRVATPSSVVSESSSNNSRSVLLLRDVPPRKTIKKSFLAVIGCNKPLCCDRSSVDEPSKKMISTTTTVDNILVKAGIPRHHHRRSLERRSPDSDFSCRQKFDEHAGLRVNSNDRFSFPIFSTGDNQTTKETVVPKQKSLQVFGSPIAGNDDKKIDPTTHALTWDALIPKPIRITSSENDSDSDASSDLFEIESFSKNIPFLSRQASDNGTTCYAPSEASVEWSVVTASAADLSELKSSSISMGLNSKIDEISINKRRSSMLSGCKSQKAVRTVEDVHKVNNNYNDKGFSRRFQGASDESYAQMTAMLYDEAGFVARSRQRSFDA